MSSTSRSVMSTGGPWRTRHFPRAISATKARTYITPYHRTASGPRWRATGSNCGWISTKGFLREQCARHYPAESPRAAASCGALHPGAHVVTARPCGHHAAAMRQAEHDPDRAHDDVDDAERRVHGNAAEKHPVHDQPQPEPRDPHPPKHNPHNKPN